MLYVYIRFRVRFGWVFALLIKGNTSPAWRSRSLPAQQALQNIRVPVPCSAIGIISSTFTAPYHYIGSESC